MKRGVENIEGPSPSLGCMFATRSIVHVVETCIGTACTIQCMYNTCRLPPKPCLFSIYKKIYSTPGNQNKTGKLAKWGVNRWNCNEKCLPDRLPPPFQNWQIAPKLAKFGARVQYRFWPVSKLAKKLAKRIRHSSHTNIRSVAHPPYQVVQRVVQQSPQRLVKTPLIEDLLDPNRPRNGLIDG